MASAALLPAVVGTAAGDEASAEGLGAVAVEHSGPVADGPASCSSGSCSGVLGSSE